MNDLLRDASNLVVFATVVQTGSITQGANRLGLERTTVSRRIKDFETHLGAKLLNRSTKRVTVTDIGRMCYKHSLRVIQAAEDATTAAKGLALDAPMVIGAPLVLIDSLLRSALAKFSAVFPMVQVEFEVLDAWNADRVGALNFMIHVGRPPAMTNTHVKALGKLRQVVVASPEYRDQYSHLNAIGDIQKHRWIGYLDNQDLISLRLTGSSQTGEVMVAPKCRVPNISTAQQAACAGLGICVLPIFACTDLLEQKKLVPVMDHIEAPGIELSLVYDDANQPGSIANAFMAFLSASLRPELSSDAYTGR